MHSKKSGIKPLLPWIILLGILAIFVFIKVLPKTIEWVSAQKQTKVITQEIETLKITLKANEEKKLDIQSKFDSESKEYVIEESQIFPEKFSAYDVSKIFELFSIQHSLLDVESVLRINSIAFSGGNEGKVGVTLNLLCTEDTLKRIIEYLQTGDLPKNFIDNEGLDASDIDYLKNHRLPVAHIQSLRISEGEIDAGVELKRIVLAISFFVQN